MSRDKRYWHEMVGYNYRLTNLQAAVGVAQMENIQVILQKKLDISKFYSTHLRGNKGIVKLDECKKLSAFKLVIWNYFR